MKRTASKFILKNKINRRIGKLQIDVRFKKIVSEIVFRRAVQYDRSWEEINTDIESLANNLTSIRIVSKAEMKAYNYALAIYCNADKEILLSAEAFSESPERIFHLLAHELHHVMLKDNRGVDRFEKYNYMLGIRSNLYQELVAEKASFRLAYPAQNDLTTYNGNAFCYDEIVFALDFIEAAYGVNEQNLLKHSLNGRKALAKFLGQSIGEESYEAEQFLDEMEVGGTLLLSSLYDEGDCKTTKKRSKAEFNENLLAGIESMFCVCQCKIDDRLRNADVETLQDAIKLKEELTFSQYRLINILKDRLVYYKNEFKLDVDKLWDKCVNKHAADTLRKLGDITQLIDYADKSREMMMVEFINTTRFLTLDDDEFFNKFFMERIKNRTHKVSKETVESKKESDRYVEGWNNKHVRKRIEQIIESEVARGLVPNRTAPRFVYEASDNSKRGAFEEYKLTQEQQEAYSSALKTQKNNVKKVEHMQEKSEYDNEEIENK